MPLISNAPVSEWRLNQINCGPPFHVETIKYGDLRESPPQVVDARGTVAVSAPYGAVFCATHQLAEAVCEAANNNQLQKA